MHRLRSAARNYPVARTEVRGICYSGRRPTARPQAKPPMSHLHRFRAAVLATILGALTLPAQAPAPGAATAANTLPLKATRTHSFTTTTGTWISLDVSPDGQTIVFDLLGDLYTLPIGGGTATRLTSGLAYDVQPRFSPDGKQIVFVSDRSGGDNLWLISVDGKDSTQITKGNTRDYTSPEWTPDGKYVIASRAGGIGGAAKLWMYHVDGGNGVALGTPPAPVKMLGAAFGKDGRYVWYAQRQGDWMYNAIGPQFQLFVYDRETGKSSQMSTRHGSATRAKRASVLAALAGRLSTRSSVNSCTAFIRSLSDGGPISFSRSARCCSRPCSFHARLSSG